MASTNKTTNYELSQYIGTDKPTYLGDYNSDMSKIDTQMKANETAAGIAKTTADTALENAETAQTEASQALNTGNTANQTATSALEKAISALEKTTANEANITAINNKFVYSTEEKVIGKWIDGKPVYKATIIKDISLGTGEKNINHNINNIKNIIDVSGSCIVNNNEWFLLPMSAPLDNVPTYGISIQSITATNLNFFVGTGMGDASKTIQATLIYTKSTD